MESKCGCFACSNRAEFYHKGKSAKANGRVYDPPNATHFEIYRRLAAVKLMHGTPGVPKPKKGGK